MVRFLARRLVWFAITLLGVSLITFVLMHAVPGGPWDADRPLPPAIIEALNQRYGLDLPGWQQYLKFVVGAAQGDLGVSFVLRQGQPVTEVIGQGLPATLLLAVGAALLATVVGLALGVGAALARGSALDTLTTVVVMLGASVPNFVLGVVLVLVLAVNLKLAPTFGWGQPQQVVLPLLTLAALPTAYVARIARAAALDALTEDYVRTARGKGLSERAVTLRHVLRNVLIPVVTVMGPITAYLATGSFVVESLYAIPGSGRLFIQAVLARDYGLIMGASLLFAAIVATANLVVDLLYAAIDPRLRTPG